MGRFFDYLKSHGRIGDLSFVPSSIILSSPVLLQWSDLYDEANLVRHTLDVWRMTDCPRVFHVHHRNEHRRWFDESFVDIFAAWWADFVGAFLEAVGTQSTTSITFPSEIPWLS